MQVWFSPAEIADAELPGLPTAKSKVIAMIDRLNWRRPDQEGNTWRPRVGRGGGFEYHMDLLPQPAKIALAIALAAQDPANHKRDAHRAQAWANFERLPDKKKDEAVNRFHALLAVEQLVWRCNTSKQDAVDAVCRQFHCTPATYYRWERLIDGFNRGDWTSLLVSLRVGRTAEAACSPEAWEAFKTAYLRPEQPNARDCYRHVMAIAAEKGWIVPSLKTLERRIAALPKEIVVLKREGREALERIYPAQERDRRVFHALEAVNADGHKWDVFVKWPDGKIERPMMTAFQDLHSGMILSWRVDRAATSEAVRLAFGDVVERYGIPDICYFDNGRDFASKQITGGAPNRYRFKLKESDPLGLLPQLGVQVHFTTPYHGQSKPIERAFGEFAGKIAKHPKFSGAYVGNKPDAKPENYGSAAVLLDVFIATVSEGIREHNERPGRSTLVCAGKLSFAQAFAQSYAVSPIRKATDEQRRLWLLAAEQIPVQADATIKLLGNRFHDAFLRPYGGKKVIVRFDPQALQQPLHVYRPDGAYLGAAACLERTGFNDVQAAREHASRRKAFVRATKEVAALEVSMPIEQLAAMIPEPDAPAPLPETKMVRPVFKAAAPRPPEREEDDYRWLKEINEMARAARGASTGATDDGDD